MATSDEQWIQWFLRVLAFIQTIIPSEWPESYRIEDGDKFDYIVVGAGSAGALLAGRLSEDARYNVLLMEAGGNPSFAQVVPSLFTTLQHTEYDWDYRGYFDKGTANAHLNGMTYVPRGKGLGGSSSMNVMAYNRGVAGDYDKWDKIAPGWAWNYCLPYFKKLEGMLDPDIMNDPNCAPFHSTEGPVLVTRPKLNCYFKEKNEIFLDALEEIGVKRIPETNGPYMYGATRPHSNFAFGRRSSSAEAYLKPAKYRTNLYVATYTRAIKVLIDPETKEAYGVEAVLDSGDTVKAFADKEVIVSAGVYESPKLLMLSGLGPETELKKFGIDIIKDLPVGKNLRDHVAVPVILKGDHGINCSEQNFYAEQEFHAYPFPITTGYFSVNSASPTQPQFQFYNIHSCANTSAVTQVCKTAVNFDDAFCKSLQDANQYRELEAVIVVLLHPNSSGSVTLQSKNPFDNPVIELGIYRDEDDLNLMAQGIKFISRLENASFYKSVGGEVARLNVTDCEGLSFGSDEHWKCYAKNIASPFLHGVGTCAMGSVVDERLRVYGIKNLRVVDASVMPSTPSGTTNVPTMMIGERAADFIKEDSDS